MKLNDLKSKSPKELEEQLSKERNFLASFRFQKAKGRSKNVKAALESRRTIARILTLFNESRHGQ